MTEAIDTVSVPPMDAVYRFMRSNPSASWEMLVEVLQIGTEETVGPSGGRFRELWLQSGGMVDRKGRAWVELQILPSVLRKIIDADALIKRASDETTSCRQFQPDFEDGKPLGLCYVCGVPEESHR